MHAGKAIPLLFVVLFSAGVSQAQWIPAKAKVTETVETIENGKVTKVERREGYFYRTSDGSTLRYWEKLNGDEPYGGGQGELQDNKNLLFYVLRMKTKEAIQQGNLPKRLTPDIHREFASASPLGDAFVAGIRCRRRPVEILWPDGRRERVGENCFSIEYALELREEARATQNGVTRHAITELHDIQMGVEPDPALFDVERNYTVFRPQPPKP